MGFGKLTPGFLFEEAGWRGLGRMGEERPAILSVVGCTVIKHCLVRFEQFAGDHRMFTSHVRTDTCT